MAKGAIVIQNFYFRSYSYQQELKAFSGIICFKLVYACPCCLIGSSYVWGLSCGMYHSRTSFKVEDHMDYSGVTSKQYFENVPSLHKLQYHLMTQLVPVMGRRLEKNI